MRSIILTVQRLVLVVSLIALSACASYSGRGLQPGLAMLPDVLTTMGEPAMHWQNADGREQLAYPRGPEGMQTFMVFLGVDGHLERIEGVLDSQHFARIANGHSDKEHVMRLLGPPQPQWTEYFKARDELVWEWRFCNDWNEVAKFDVLFDATTGIVRSTYQRTDYGDFPELFFDRRSHSHARTCAH